MRHHQVRNVRAICFYLLDPDGFTTSARCSNSLCCSIENIKKIPVYSYTGTVSEHVGWIRRELLLKKASSGDISRVLPVLSELENDDLQKIVQWLPESTQVDGKFFFKFPAMRLLISIFSATMMMNLHLAHWPEVVRKMAAHLKGLVEGVLNKKAAKRHGSRERMEVYAREGADDLPL